MIQLIFSDDNETQAEFPSIFLAGPSPRDTEGFINNNWRRVAIELISVINEDITLYLPLPSSGVVDNYDNQVEWEEQNLNKVDVILFWIPRDLVTLPAFTTNFEFGEYYKSGKVVYGRPDSAPKNKYLDYKYTKHNKGETIYRDLKSTLLAAYKKAKQLYDTKQKPESIL
jgi:hypothetical protein